MNYNIVQFLYGIGQTYPILGNVFVFISGPLSFILIPLVILVTLSIKAKENFMQTFSLIFLSGFFSFLCARILKEIFKIARPYVAHTDIIPLAPVSGFSFPSEHASVYGALTVLLFHFDYRFGIVSLVFTLLVMVSRVVMGVHYPVDVLAGCVLGG
jgi:undecaprenyl-diphosphatase